MGLIEGQSSIGLRLMGSSPNENLSGDETREISPVEVARIGRLEEPVPSTWNQALHRFFLGDVGPPSVVLSISGFLLARSRLPVPFSAAEGALFASSVLFWWIQEYFIHRALLHSPFDWVGKSIHREHHERDYFQVSIDPPALLLGWLFAAHLAMKCIFPWHLCLTATVGYSLAGLVYEWSHYIVHTRVKPPAVRSDKSMPSATVTGLSRLYSQMRDNHVRHHMVDDRYWFAFSVPAMDNFLNTNPDVRQVRGRSVDRVPGKSIQ